MFHLVGVAMPLQHEFVQSSDSSRPVGADLLAYGEMQTHMQEWIHLSLLWPVLPIQCGVFVLDLRLVLGM